MQKAPREHSAILSTFIKLPFVIKIFVSSIFERPFYTGFTVICQFNLYYVIYELQQSIPIKSMKSFFRNNLYYIHVPIKDSYSELSVFWSSDTEIRLNELRFSDSVPLSFKSSLI